MRDNLPDPITNTLLDLALQEDLGTPFQDLTTQLFYPDHTRCARARIISKHASPVVVSGVSLARQIMQKLTTEFALDIFCQDKAVLSPGQTLLAIEAPVQVLLQVERILLNFLRHLSGIATLTQRYVAKVQGTGLKILDTRKTTPGLRVLEKRAVTHGGGVNHRMGLYDAMMIKDTHIDAQGGIGPTLDVLIAQPSSTNTLPVIIEVRSLLELTHVLEKAPHHVSRVLLDNMTLLQLTDCARMCQGVMQTEASGNLRLDTIRQVAETGVHYASVGALTYAAEHVDLSMVMD